MKTLEVGYTLPKSIVNKMRFNKIRVFFIGTNILTFAKFKEWDPEMGVSNGEKYPLAKTFYFGINCEYLIKCMKNEKDIINCILVLC